MGKMKQVRNKATLHPYGYYILTITKRTGETVDILVDAADIEAVQSRNWCITTNGYAQNSTKKKTVLMHRFIMGIEKDSPVQVDHKSTNKCDNRRENLRICTGFDNAKNRRGKSCAASGAKGVWYIKNRKHPWRSFIQSDKVRIHVGYYSTKEAAVLAYNRAAIQYHGDFARLNEM